MPWHKFAYHYILDELFSMSDGACTQPGPWLASRLAVVPSSTIFTTLAAKTNFSTLQNSSGLSAWNFPLPANHHEKSTLGITWDCIKREGAGKEWEERSTVYASSFNTSTARIWKNFQNSIKASTWGPIKGQYPVPCTSCLWSCSKQKNITSL